MCVCMHTVSCSHGYTGIYALELIITEMTVLPVTEEELRHVGFQRRCHDLSDRPYFFFFMFSSNNLQSDGSSVVDIRVIYIFKDRQDSTLALKLPFQTPGLFFLLSLFEFLTYKPPNSCGQSHSGSCSLYQKRQCPYSL